MNMEAYSFQKEAGIETGDFSLRLGTYVFTSDVWERATCVPDYYLTYIIDPGPRGAYPRQATPGASKNTPLTLMPPTFAPQFHDAPHRLRVAQCIFSQGAFERITAQRWKSEGPQSFMNVHNRRVRDLVMLLKREVTEPGFDSVIMAESLGRILMLEIARHFRVRQSRRPGNKLSSWQLKRISDVVHESCGNGSAPSVSDLAAVCGVSAGHLMRSFRMSTGSTLLGFIDGARIDKAKALLVDTSLPLKCIAADAGFPNATRFSERFKILTGERPSDFRARNRGTALGVVHRGSGDSLG